MRHIVALTISPSITTQFAQISARFPDFFVLHHLMLTAVVHPNDLVPLRPIFGIFAEAALDVEPEIGAAAAAIPLLSTTPRVCILVRRSSRVSKMTTLRPYHPLPYSILVLPVDDELIALRISWWVRESTE